MSEDETVKEKIGPAGGLSHEMNIVGNPVVKAIFLAGGVLSIALGVAGIFIPLLPTTPFLLLAAYLLSRSSVRYYTWLMNHRVFGPYIRNYREGKGIPGKVKLSALIFLWVTILFSIFYVIELILIQMLLLAIATAVSMHISLLPTLVEESSPEQGIHPAPSTPRGPPPG